MNHVGWLDSASFTRVSGWANAAVAIHVNGERVATETPAIERKDLDGKGFGFDVPIDPLRLVRGANDISVTFVDNGSLIGNGARKVELAASPELISGYSLGAIARGMWTLVDARKSDDQVILTGWCVAPPGIPSASIFSNGETIHFSARPDARLQAQTWLPAETQVRVFDASFKFRDPIMRVSFGNHDRSFNPDHDCTIPQELSLQPGRDRVRRVSGGFDSFKFDIQGRTNAACLRRAFARHGRLPLSEARVLDWGVGAGRVARFIAPDAGAFHGVDVDADNLAWCKDNLKGSYLNIAVEPPTPLPPGQFDFIYGISVVTHLSREDERAWLVELRRLVADDGVVALSIHGPIALMTMGLCDRHAQLAAEGFVDLGENKILAGRVPDGYYRNVAHSFTHLHNVWGEFFVIEDILPGAIGIQDLVVLRPR